MMPDITNMLVVGVGGQGVILVSRVVGEAALRSDLSVMTNEIHGMAQRGGMVMSEIRIGEVYSPMIGKGEADQLVGLEPVETYRYSDRISRTSTVVVSPRPVYPFTVTSAREEYPEPDELLRNLESVCGTLVVIDPVIMATDAGLPALVGNMIMLGVMCRVCEDFPLSVNRIKEAIKEIVPDEFSEINISAFELGHGSGGP
jgi:indolepyruvate ferredoxin oxidoreductase beta subunit